MPTCHYGATWRKNYGAWLGDRLEAVRSEARTNTGPLPAKLPHDAPLFNVPTGLISILDRDLAAAGVPNRDDRGRTVDVHAMRHTFGTHLSKGGVSPRTAQAALRHSTIDLTMNTYTDPRLLDVAGSLEVLPSLLLPDAPSTERATATGTDPRTLVPLLVPEARIRCIPKTPKTCLGCLKRGSRKPPMPAQALTLTCIG